MPLQPQCPVTRCTTLVFRSDRLCDPCFRRLPRNYAEPLCQKQSEHRTEMLSRAVAFLNRYADEDAFRSKPAPASLSLNKPSLPVSTSRNREPVH